MSNDLLDSPVKGVNVRNDALSSLTEAEKEKLYQYTANLMTTGFSNDQIREKLLKLGHSEEIVNQMMQELSVARTEVAQVNKSLQRGRIFSVLRLIRVLFNLFR